MANMRQYIKLLFNVFGLQVQRYRPELPSPEAGNEYNTSQGKVKVISFAWGTTNQLFDFIDREVYTHWNLDAENYGAPRELVERHKWGLKGFGYSLVIDTVRKLHSNGKQMLKVLDVGG